MFWIGLLPALLVFWIRRFVEEPELSVQRRASRSAGRHLFAALKPPYLATTWRVAHDGDRRARQQLRADDFPADLPEDANGT